MTQCNDCNVRVQSKAQFCPLCGAALQPVDSEGFATPHNSYPDLLASIKQYHFVRRILIAATIIACGTTVMVNLLTDPSFLWSIIVLLSVAYCWIVIPPLLRQGVNYASQVVMQVILTSLFLVAIDFMFGFSGWSVTYAIPSLLGIGILAISMLILFNRTNWAQYVLFQVIIGIFGFIPLVLYFFNISQNLIMVLVVTAMAFADIVVIVVFGDRSVKSEFKRRFHI